MHDQLVFQDSMQFVRAVAASCLLLQCRGFLLHQPPAPGIGQAFLNLGKIDVSIHLNSPDAGKGVHSGLQAASQQALRGPLRMPEDPEPCPCSRMQDVAPSRPSLGRFSELFERLLLSNDMFSVNQDLNDRVPSVSCCGSRGDDNDVMMLEISGPNPAQHFPQVPFLFPSGNEKVFSLPSRNNRKKESKTKKRDMSTILNKADIRIVGDKELFNTFKIDELRPIIFKNFGEKGLKGEVAEVKKEKEVELDTPEKEETDIKKEKEVELEAPEKAQAVDATENTNKL